MVVADIAEDELALGGILLPQVAQVQVGALAPQIVEEDDVPAVLDEGFGGVHADESCAAGDKGRFLCQARSAVQRSNLTCCGKIAAYVEPRGRDEQARLIAAGRRRAP